MASKKKSTRKKAARKKKASPLESRIRQLEKRLRALERNPVLDLHDVFELDRGKVCKTLKVVGNLQVVNGMGTTNTTNGCGNLIIGYNEPPPGSSGWSNVRTGSHNHILGRYHSHASYAGLLSGEMNRTTANAPSSCVVGGSEGSVNGDRSVIVGGHEGKANSNRCVVMGGFDNGSNGANLSVVIGGTNNRADADSSCIFGGGSNTTNSSAGGSTILGGSHLSTSTPGERIPP
jgi:hypothetical protein